MTTYILRDGTDTTLAEIQAAFARGEAVLCHSRGNHGTVTGLMLDGQHYDTRGQCVAMREEAWTTTPKSWRQAAAAASVDVGKP